MVARDKEESAQTKQFHPRAEVGQSLVVTWLRDLQVKPRAVLSYWVMWPVPSTTNKS